VKMLHCLECGDLVRLYRAPRRCHCGRSTGRYVNDTHVALVGPCRALGIDSGELRGEGGTWHVSARVVRDG
jgi:hypothetical protein